MGSQLIEVLSRVEKHKKDGLKRRKARYTIARELGLPSTIAKPVSSWKESRIRLFAKEYHEASAEDLAIVPE